MATKLSEPVKNLVDAGEQALAGGDVDAAVKSFDKAMEIAEGPERDVVVVGRGHVLMGAGRGEDAAACFKDALTRAENDLQKQFLEAMIKMAQEKTAPTTENIAAAAGMELKSDCNAESHCASHAVSDEVSAAEAAMIAHVSAHGEAKWQELLDELNAAPNTEAEFSTVEQLEAVWTHVVKPMVRDKIKGDEELPCGHTCGTCPTRTSCKLHDIEDMA